MISFRIDKIIKIVSFNVLNENYIELQIPDGSIWLEKFDSKLIVASKV